MSSRERWPLGTRVIRNGDTDGKNYSLVRQQYTADDDARRPVVNDRGYSGRGPGAVVSGRRFVPSSGGIKFGTSWPTQRRRNTVQRRAKSKLLSIISNSTFLLYFMELNLLLMLVIVKLSFIILELIWMHCKYILSVRQMLTKEAVE